MKHYFIVPVLVIGLSMSACDRGTPVDPDMLGQQAGKRASQFYKAISEQKLTEAILYFSTDIRQQYTNYLDEPLLQLRSENAFQQIVARLDHVDWRHKTVYFSVGLRTITQMMENGPLAMDLYGTRIDAWILEDGEWVYNGGTLKPKAQFQK